LKTTDFDFHLPSERIAAHPAARRDSSRLLVLDRDGGVTRHAFFRDLDAFLPPRSLLVVNDTRVIPARLRGRKATGGAVEILLTRKVESTRVERNAGHSRIDEQWEALSKGLSGATVITFGPLSVEVLARRGKGRILVRLTANPVPTSHGILSLLDDVGEIPLPPYVETARRQSTDSGPARSDEVETLDRQRYQTVYATSPGAVAAPTAGLHFTPELLTVLRSAGHEVAPVTLHVGPGTFRPVETEDPRDHEMDEEHYFISPETAQTIDRARREGRAIVAVGTTVVRTLESAARLGGGTIGSGDGKSRLFLAPGDLFLVVTDLITNFHLPRSTLLMLVAAFAGRDRVLAAYQVAIANDYRFYSYGDAMLIRSSRR
jgi:S-adenosylmethionine:tRNA ribosyltransferase-isomerase